MGLKDIDTAPEIKLARRIFAKHKLTVPFDLDKVVGEYATIIYKSIPISGIDGVSIHLKVPGKTPIIIVNSDLPKTRQKFTLAHELGHIIIPWHIGTIVDEVYSQDYKDFHYGLLEQEANAFAAELLMPNNWVLSEYERLARNLEMLQAKIVLDCKVSDQAAAIRMIHLLPSQIIYAAVDGDVVIHSGKTKGTHAFQPEKDSIITHDIYPYIENHYLYQSAFNHYHWWNLNTIIDIKAVDHRSWRDVLLNMISDIDPPTGFEKFRMTINGIVAAANSSAKKQFGYSIESIIVAMIYRLRREELNDFVNHNDFEIFVKKRAMDFFNGVKN